MVEKEEAEAQKMAGETRAIAEDAQRDLAEALPALDAAVACLNKLKKSDIDEVRAMKKPPAGVKLTMQATCIMFMIKPVMKVRPPRCPPCPCLRVVASVRCSLSRARCFRVAERP